MEFPIVDLLDEDICELWLMKYLHPRGPRCPQCGAGVDDARRFRRQKRSGIQVYRCQRCQTPFSVYTGTVFAGKHLRPSQTIMLLRGVCKGEPSATLAREIGVARQTVLTLRHELQRNVEAHQPQDPLPDPQTETDEMFQNAGKKGEKHSLFDDPPRRRANQQRGHGTYANDRPPVVGTVGRFSEQVRLRVVSHTDAATLRHHVHTFTLETATVNTDEWRGYTHVARRHVIVSHLRGEWARDDDGDGIREVHSNTIESVWTTTRNFLRPLRGVHKRYLSGYIAVCEFAINLKRVTPEFISMIVTKHYF